MPKLPTRIPQPQLAQHALASLAAFIRERLGEVGRWARPEPGAGQVATVIVAAAAPFASNSYARARLLRQLHASGLLDDRETEQVEDIFGVAQ